MKFRIHALTGHKDNKVIVFDIDRAGARVANDRPGLWYSNMTVAEAKALRKRLKRAIKTAEKRGF